MKIVIDNVRIVLPMGGKDGEERNSEVLYLGGKLRAQNPRKFSGDFVSVVVSCEVKPAARVFEGSSYVGHDIRFGEIVEATPAKK